MKLIKILLTVWLGCAPFAGVGRAADISDIASKFEQAPGPYAVEVMRYDWMDAKRDRDVPVKIYFPKTGAGPFPVIIFSHGLGGSREGYSYLGRYWASHGYVCVHLQHLGSDSSVWEDVAPAERMQALRDAVNNIQNAINRPADVSFAIDQVVKLNQSEPQFKQRLDLDHIGMAGHSFGAYTTMAIAGQRFTYETNDDISMGDPRVKAAIAMSSPVLGTEKDWDKAYGKISIPVFHMTGTKDNSPVGETKAAQRRVPFDHSNASDEYLVTFNGADHMTFSGRLLQTEAADQDKMFQGFILRGSTAFWDAYLKGDAEAKKWLVDGGFADALGDVGKFEEKLHKQE